MVPAGQILQKEVGIKDTHFTVLPINNLLGKLVFVTVIFKGKKLDPRWALGVNIFAKLNKECNFGNFGTGKRYPGLSLFREDGS